MSPTEPRWTAELVAQRLQNLQPIKRARRTDEASERLWAYREAAAVLASFDPDQLQPLGPPASVGEPALRQLLADCTVVYDAEQRPWSALRTPVRKAALRRLGSRDALKAALAANPTRLMDTQQTMLEAYISHTAPPLDKQNLEQLSSTLQVTRWLDGMLEGVPEYDEVRQRLERENLLKPFKFLVGDHFRGRQAELRELRDYVAVLPPNSKLQYVARGMREIFSLHEKPPLLIYGPGGMGKSTLLAKFILEHDEVDQYLRFPYVYLDFDRPGLAAEEPVSLLVEAVRQLGAQYPRVRTRAEAIREAWLRRLTPPSASVEQRAAQKSAPNIALPGITDRGRFLAEFGEFYAALEAPDRPFLLIMDTFEEVQYRSRDFVEALWTFLNELQAVIPRLRTVIAGRAPVRDFKTHDLPLTHLDPEAAQGFLEAQGVSDPDVARQVVQQLGGNPLSLKLAADVIEKEGSGPDGIQGLRTRSYFVFHVHENLIQGQLYRRILAHIHDEEVKKLAHPGLVLRRLTPELIATVLAKPCGVEVRDAAHAQRLFDELRREVSLVTPAEDGALRHRPDVRRVMIDLLRADQPAKVQQIHRRAVAFYYRGKDSAPARAEELYHRLSLGQKPSTLNKRWMDGVEEYLRNAIEELDPPAQTYLASRIGVELDESIWAEADLEAWERRTERRVQDLLRLDRPERARGITRAS